MLLTIYSLRPCGLSGTQAMIPGTVTCVMSAGHVTAGLSPVSWRGDTAHVRIRGASRTSPPTNRNRTRDTKAPSGRELSPKATEGECEYFGLKAFHPNGQPYRFARGPFSRLWRQLLAAARSHSRSDMRTGMSFIALVPLRYPRGTPSAHIRFGEGASAW